MQGRGWHLHTGHKLAKLAVTRGQLLAIHDQEKSLPSPCGRHSGRDEASGSTLVRGKERKQVTAVATKATNTSCFETSIYAELLREQPRRMARTSLPSAGLFQDCKAQGAWFTHPTMSPCTAVEKFTGGMLCFWCLKKHGKAPLKVYGQTFFLVQHYFTS